MLPREVQRAFKFDLFGKGGATYELLNSTVTSQRSIAAMARDALEVKYNRDVENG